MYQPKKEQMLAPPGGAHLKPCQVKKKKLNILGFQVRSRNSLTQFHMEVSIFHGDPKWLVYFMEIRA